MDVTCLLTIDSDGVWRPASAHPEEQFIRGDLRPCSVTGCGSDIELHSSYHVHHEFDAQIEPLQTAVLELRKILARRGDDAVSVREAQIERLATLRRLAIDDDDPEEKKELEELADEFAEHQRGASELH